jgi:hypothetical protein
MIGMVINTHSASLSRIGLTIRSATIRRLGVLIEYGAFVAQIVSLVLSAQARLMKSCEAPELNNIMIGCSNKKNVPTRTSSLGGISSTVVKLARPTLKDDAWIIAFC